LEVDPIQSLSISPPLATITLDGGLGITNDAQSFTVQGADASGDTVDLTGQASFSISPNGTCNAGTCTANDVGAQTVTAAYGSLTTSAILIVLSGPFAPTVTKVRPSYGSPAGGITVTVLGEGFGLGKVLGRGENAFSTSVDFGSTPAMRISVISSTRLSAVAPAGTGTVDVTVTTYLDGSSFGTSPTVPVDQFSYGPTVTKLNRHSGPPKGGTTVVIQGTNFQRVKAVDFGSSPAERYTVSSSTRIRAVSPAGTGTVDVTVDTAGGSSPTGTFDLFSYSSQR